MKRSEINAAFRAASDCFARHQWALPPEPRWDITDFGLGRFQSEGLTLINLAEEPEYCEKLMFAWKGQTTPAHTHRIKKEDIICRAGRLSIQVWQGTPAAAEAGTFPLQVNGESRRVASGEVVTLKPGERVTLTPGTYHAFWPESDECIIGEVSTANDDATDNVFVDPDIGRFPEILKDEQPLVTLISEG